jgi:hypothetical protein
MAVHFLPDDAINLLVVHQRHVNVKASSQQFGDRDVFLPLAE